MFLGYSRLEPKHKIYEAVFGLRAMKLNSMMKTFSLMCILNINNPHDCRITRTIQVALKIMYSTQSTGNSLPYIRQRTKTETLFSQFKLTFFFFSNKLMHFGPTKLNEWLKYLRYFDAVPSWECVPIFAAQNEKLRRWRSARISLGFSRLQIIFLLSLVFGLHVDLTDKHCSICFWFFGVPGFVRGSKPCCEGKNQMLLLSKGSYNRDYLTLHIGYCCTAITWCVMVHYFYKDQIKDAPSHQSIFS